MTWMPHAVGRISEFGVVDAGPSTFFFHGCLISSVITKETAGPDTERGTSPDFGSVQRSFTGQHCFFLPLTCGMSGHLPLYSAVFPYLRAPLNRYALHQSSKTIDINSRFASFLIQVSGADGCI